MELSSIRTLLIDGDGVLWRAGDPMPGLAKFFDTLTRLSITWGLLTNNAAPTVADYLTKLKGFGVEADANTIISSSIVTSTFLHDLFGGTARLYVIGQQGLKQTLGDAGFVIDDEPAQSGKIDAVVVGIDRQFTFHKLAVAQRLINGGARFIATNTDNTFPTPDGLLPGAGSLVSAVATATGKRPVIMGKPEPAMFEVAMSRFDADMATTAMLGDRLETDILGARSFGLGTILVLSGVSARDDISRLSIQPDYIFDDIAALSDALDKVTSTV